MNSRPSLLPVVLAVLALPSALVGQDAGRPPAEQSAPAPDAAQVPAPAGRGAQALDRGAGETGRTPDRDAALARMRAAEEEHRERVAAIRHLRELAVRAGQAERVAQFDELEASENARFRSETEAESRKPSRKVVIRKVRTGARAAGARGASPQPRDPSAGPPPDGGTPPRGSATPRGDRPRTSPGTARPSGANRSRSGSGGSSAAPRP